MYLIMKNFLENLKTKTLSPATRKTLDHLFALYAVTHLIQEPAGVIDSQYLTPAQFTLLDEARDRLLQLIRPEAIAITESFGFQEMQLESVLASKDGKTYEKLLEKARSTNLNR